MFGPVQPCPRGCPVVCAELDKVKRLQHEAELAAAVYEPADPANPRKGLSPDNPYQRVTSDDELAKLGIEMDDLEPGNSKFRAGVFKDENGNYIISYKGTSEKIDWLHNGLQGTVGKSDYYSRAKDIATSAAEEIGNDGVRSVKFVGHSLGGGLASAASHATGQPGTTFNAAGLHILNRRWFKTAPPIDAVSTKGELLTTVQRNTFAFEAVGTPYRLEAPPTSASGIGEAARSFIESSNLLSALKGYVVGATKRSLELHGMESMDKALAKRRQRVETEAQGKGCTCP